MKTRFVLTLLFFILTLSIKAQQIDLSGIWSGKLSLPLQVPPKENLSAIDDALKRGGNNNYETKMLQGLNHLFQTSKTGAISEYSRIEETVSPLALETMLNWLSRFVK